MNTLQLVSGAIGTALYISIMSGGQKQYLSGASDPQAPAEIAKGLAAGINNAFWFGVIVVLVIGLFLRKGKSQEHEQASA
ncbi:drug resistance transporter EmrB/QacA subfamily protein [Paenibacillus terrae HPL-003]|uniref:Drug resistance transporter EmrB/QacA subfamily protein n=1 Tax=Paenibacillus terrae (strain HPL-003) TaxID=985665 RepID=G7VQP0_PAETH|nr:drug resistance transporter EmrB/QacA subfamily protein [Paenibacillus terrae]AET61229.1 drug resistance transporter EmrB/QacA subfamily protein [Paenibacillus terrae HPL-003]